MKEKSHHEQVEVRNVKENTVITEIKENPVEDQFELKMQSEMNQMKEKLKLDFSKEVQALEDEIDALRKTYDTKGYTTDEGKLRIYYSLESLWIFVGLGHSRSRLRLTEETSGSEDELDRIIKQRQKKLQKSNLEINLHLYTT